VESVAWAAERKDVLSMFFGMATIYVYALYVEEQKLARYFLCLILFALGLMAKPMLVTLPFIMLLLDFWPLGRWQKALYSQNTPTAANNTASVKKKKQHKQNASPEKKLSLPVPSRGQLIGNLLWEKVPFIFLAIILSIALIWQQQAVGGMVSLQKISFSERLINTIVSYVSYLGKIFWPVDLAVFYPYEYSFPIWHIGGAALILIIISIAVIYFIKKAPFLFVGWFWYVGSLFPVIGLMQAGAQAMADRYTYLPSIGIGIMLIWGIGYLLPKEKLRKIIFVPVAVILVSLTFLTWQQCGYWKNSIELFNHALQVTKDNDLAHVSLGIALDAAGKSQEAMYNYQTAIKINPLNYKAHYNLANALKEQGNIEESLKYFQETLLINPNIADAHNNIGIILDKYLNKNDEAIYHFRQALQMELNNSHFHFNLGIALAKKGELKEAIEHFRTAVYLNPNYEDARRALRLALEMDHQKR
jgi:tetratricopeptide (TPR) repeat protein